MSKFKETVQLIDELNLEEKTLARFMLDANVVFDIPNGELTEHFNGVIPVDDQQLDDIKNILYDNLNIDWVANRSPLTPAAMLIMAIECDVLSDEKRKLAFQLVFSKTSTKKELLDFNWSKQKIQQFSRLRTMVFRKNFLVFEGKYRNDLQKLMDIARLDLMKNFVLMFNDIMLKDFLEAPKVKKSKK